MLGAAAALLYGYYLWGGIKEMAGAMLMIVLAVLTTAAGALIAALYRPTQVRPHALRRHAGLVEALG